MKADQQEIKVTLMTRVKIDGIWRRMAVVYGKTGRVIPGLTIRDGKERRFEDVAYELRYYRDGKVRYTPAGKNASDAEEKRRTLATRLSAKAIAKDAGVAVIEDPERKSIKRCFEDYAIKKSVLVDDAQLRKIKYGIGIFLKINSKDFVDELTETDILKFLDTLRAYPVYWLVRKSPSKRTQATQIRRRLPSKHRCISKRTVFQYFMIVRSWLLKAGADRNIFPPPPRFEEKEVTIYTPEEIDTFLSIATGNLRMAVSLMLKCGMRRQEAAHAYFNDINDSERTILIREKPEFGFQTKTRKQRVVPVPDDLFEELREWKKQHPGQMLIIQTAKGKPDVRMIRHLKRFAYLYGLRCGRCGHCRSGHPDCGEWELHKFRRTYITAICRSVDLRTAQEYAGHTRLSSTQRYLKPGSAAEGQKRVSQIDFTKSFY
jgi:integrase